jgi:hypothetical protein
MEKREKHFLLPTQEVGIKTSALLSLKMFSVL